MQKKKSEIISMGVYVVFFIWSIIALAIVFKNISGRLAIALVVGYVIYLFLLFLYVVISIIINARKLKSNEIRKRLFRFLIMVMFFGGLNYILDYFFIPEKLDIFKSFANAFGIAIVITFVDVTLLNKVRR